VTSNSPLFRCLRSAGLALLATLFVTADADLRSGNGGIMPEIRLVAPAHADDDGDDGGSRAGASSTRGDRGGTPVTRPRSRNTSVFPFRLPFLDPPRRRTRVVRTAAPVPAAPRRPDQVASGLTRSDLDRLIQRGFSVAGERQLAILPGLTVRLIAPRGLSTARAIARVRTVAPDELVDRNRRYGNRYWSAAAPSPGGPPAQALGQLDWPDDPGCRSPVRLAVIDTGIDRNHPALQGRDLDVVVARSDSRADSGSEHGTAVAALLLLSSGSTAPPLVLIDAFHRVGNGDQADAFDILHALDIAVARGAGVVNMSLAGPANAVLDKAGATVAGRGIVIVAAVGNEGPRAAPLFPAAYPWAIAVTAIDGREEVFRSANRGAHVDIAAPGVRIPVTDSRGRERLRSGTSFAAPFVALTLAAWGPRLSHAGNGDPHAGLRAIARDLGEAGPDEVFGAGLPQVGRLCAG
jgi:hypothetical protein